MARLLAALLSVCCAPRAWAQTLPAVAPVEQPIGVLLLEAPGSDWPSRARGQLSDLGVRLSQARLGSDPDPSKREQQARLLAGASGAQVVAWIEADATPPARWTRRPRRGSHVVLWLAGSGQARARRLGEAWPALRPLDRSAALEVAALALRSAVRSMLLERAGADPPPAEPTPPPRREPEPRAPDSPVWLTALGIGWQGNGQSPLGSPGLLAELGLSQGRWTGLLEVRFGLPTSFEVGEIDVGLRQHAVFGSLRYTLTSRAGLALEPLVRAGVALSHRDATPSTANVRVTASEVHLAAAFGVGLRVAWEFAAEQQLALLGVAEWHPAAPAYVVQRTSTDETLSEPLWNIQPALELQWALAW